MTVPAGTLLKGTYRSIPLAIGCALALSSEAGAGVLGYDDERLAGTTRVVHYTSSNKIVAQLKDGKSIDLGTIDEQAAAEMKGMRTLAIARVGSEMDDIQADFVSIRRI